MSEYLLEMIDIEKSFHGVKVLKKVKLQFKAGTIHAIMGENGAGKSTLMKCLLGMYTKDGGRILIDGEEAIIPNTNAALRMGIAMIHQELSPVPERSVMDNIWLGREPVHFKFLVNHKEMYRNTIDILQSLSIQIDPNELMSNLTVAKMQMIEIAKAISNNAKILIMDEPTSALTGTETAHLFKIMRQLKDKGVLIIYISHKMDEIYTICDEVSILRDGEYIDTRNIQDITMDQIITKMVGREINEMFPKVDCPLGNVIMKVENLGSGKAFRKVSFDLRKNEILGISGLVGAGRTELLETLFGLRKATEGTISINNQVIRINSPIIAKKHKLAFLTEDRRLTGIIPVLSVTNNMTVAALDTYTTKLKFIRFKLVNRFVNEYMTKLRIKAANTAIEIQNLSGGNQQKVLIARWLLVNPDIFLVDEPTRGVDVGAKAEIYSILTALAQEGMSIIMVSSEMPELLGMCDRILVMYEGTMTGIVERSHANQETLMRYATSIN